MNSEKQQFIGKDLSYAIVGVTPNREKYGNIVLRDLGDAGYAVVGVNPKYRSVEGYPTYAAISDIPKKPDVVVFVVPPAIGLELLNDVKAAGISRVWFQPGAENDAVRAKARELGLTAVADGSCIMVARHAFETHHANT